MIVVFVVVFAIVVVIVIVTTIVIAPSQLMFILFKPFLVLTASSKYF